MRLLTLPGVFKPRSDGWLLAAVAGVLAPGRSCLDLFTGSGVVAVTSALAGARSVTVVDVSRRAVFAARLNARLNGASVTARRGDLVEPVAGARFDLITANPPYLPGADELPARGSTRAWEGGRDGRRLLDRLCREAHGALTPAGILLLVQSSVNGEAETIELLREGGLEARVAARRRGPLGPLLAARRERIPQRRLLADGGEEILVIEARQPVSRSGGAGTR